MVAKTPLLPPGSPPPCDGLDIAAFVKVFRDKNTSYKFFWARALMQALANNGFQSRAISFVKMAAGMLDGARRAVCIFHLRFPKDDKLDKEWFPQLEGAPHWGKKKLTRLRGDVFAPQAHKIPGDIIRGLTKFVPYLFLSPFFAGMPGLAGGVKFNKIKEKAAACFDGESPPPYRFTEAGDGIIVHPKWAQYFARNIAIINGWIMWELAQYTQKINPTIPAIITKLDDATEPKTTKQREFWRKVISRKANVFCIYTGEKIDADNFALDHYLPWSFVAHDNMWNLVPVSVAGNAEKSDNLPSSEEYFSHFADMQHIAVKSLPDIPGKHDWQTLFESYPADLSIETAQAAADKNALYSALSGVVEPLLAIAKTRGFSANWKFGEN